MSSHEDYIDEDLYEYTDSDDEYDTDDLFNSPNIPNDSETLESSQSPKVETTPPPAYDMTVPDYSSDEYCHTQCEFYHLCYANHEACIKQTFEDALSSLSPMEEQVIKLLYGWNNYPPLTIDMIAKRLDTSTDQIIEIKNNAHHKLLSDVNLGFLYSHKAFALSSENFYSNFFADSWIYKPSLQITTKLGFELDYLSQTSDESGGITYINKNKSIVELKADLEKSIADFEDLQPFLPYLQKINITTLNHLLHTSSKKLFFDVFEKNDVLYFELYIVLTHMGFLLDGNSGILFYNQFWDNMIEELKVAGFNASIYEQTLEELPLGVFLTLYEKGIFTVADLLTKRPKYIASLNDEQRTQIANFLTKNHLLIHHEEKIFYITPNNLEKFLSKLVWWLAEHSHSVFSLKNELEKANCSITNSIVPMVTSIYPDYNFWDYLLCLGEADSLTCSITIEELVLSVRSFNCLKRAGIDTVGDLVQRSVEDLIRVRNMGKKNIDEIISKLAELGLTLRSEE